MMWEAEARERLQPQAEDAEKSILGSLLMSNDNLERVADIIGPEHFFVPVHGRIFDACQKVAAQGKIADPFTLKAYFTDDADLAEVGGNGYLAKLLAAAAPPARVTDYAREVRDAWIRREVIAVADEATERAYRPEPGERADGLIADTEAGLYRIASGIGHTSGPVALSRLTGPMIEAAQSAYQRGSRMAGAPTGLADLDALLGGLQRGKLYVLAARPAMGKSALATQIAMACASASPEAYGGSVLFESLEMTDSEVTARLMALRTGIAPYQIEGGTLQQADFETMLAAKAELDRLPIKIDEAARPTVAQIHNRARRVARRHGRLGLLIVDHIGLVAPSPELRRAQKVYQIEEITNALKAMAKELDCPVLALSQLSREVEKREDKRPMLADLRDSGSIEQDADVIMFLYRAEYYLARQHHTTGSKQYADWLTQMAAEEGRAEVIVAKHRGGPTGDRHMRFDAPLMHFTDL